MKKAGYFIVVVLIALIVFCFKYFNDKRNSLGIYPLKPYADSIKFTNDEDVSPERRKGIQIRYYVFDTDGGYTPNVKNKMDTYIAKYLRKEIKQHQAIYLTFYKQSLALNKDSEQNTAELNGKYRSQKFAEYEYINARLFNFDYYKNGQYYEPPTDNDDSEN